MAIYELVWGQISKISQASRNYHSRKHSVLRAELKPGNSTTFISTKAKSSVIKFYEMLVQQKYYKELLLLISGNIQDFT
ncbi:unnamed protein product [Tenebrio molitor]|nr:unnamed protein product [Tenebrio molitor]